MLSITVNQALKKASMALEKENARREAEYIVSYVLNWPISKLIAYPEYTLTLEEFKNFHEVLDRRIIGEPLAYIKKNKSFWNIHLEVNDSVLIPRPETELLIEKILSLNLMNPSVLDLGTGSGAIAIALAFNQPIWQITATDISHQALNVAKHNAQKYKLNNIQFYQGSWFSALPSHAEAKFDVIVSNPPYIAPDSVYLSLGDVLFEPLQALVANNQGLADLQHIISHAKNYLNEQGFLVVEHGYDQQEAVKTMFIDAGFSNIATLKDFQSHPRVTYGLFGETDLLK